MDIYTQVTDLKQALSRVRTNHSIGFVPTMGALHEGHLSLIRSSLAQCDLTVVSIFVNPAQFSPNEDLVSYPRPIESDTEMLASLNVDLLFTPTPNEIYPNDITRSTNVTLPHYSTRYCGQSRPHFFGGITTVVCRLFNLIQPHYAFFGEKDFQQAFIVKRMVSDLFIPVDIVVCPIIREKSGLAMSSRNRYLSETKKKDAAALYKALQLGRKLFSEGCFDPTFLIQSMKNDLSKTPIQLDYLTIINPDTLEPVTRCREADRILIGAWLEQTRLIDTVVLGT